MHPQFVGAESQAANWKKIKDLLSEAIIRKCAAQLRIVYNEIGKAKTKVSGLIESFVDTVKNESTQQELEVDLKSLLTLASVQPTFLGQLESLSKKGVQLAEILTADKLANNFPQLSQSQPILALVNHLLQLRATILQNVEFMRGIIGDITRVKKAGSLSSQIYDDMVVFVLNVKKEVSGNMTRDRIQELVRLYKTKKMTLDLFLQETLACCLLAGFGEYWDYSACLYQNEKGSQSEALLVRADDKLRSYLQEFFSSVQQQIYPVVVAEKNADMLFTSYGVLNDLSTLPVIPKETKVNLPQPLELAFATIRLFLPFATQSLHDLFSDQLFCYFYSLFKQAVDGMLRDYRVTLGGMAQNVYNQVIQRFDKSSFAASHVTVIDVNGDRSALQALYFRPVKVTKYLIENCSKRIPTGDLQRLAYDCIEASTRALFDCANLFADKTDGLLFVLKNLVCIYVFLSTSIDSASSTVKLTQLNYNPRIAGLDNILAGRMDLATISNAIYELMPRVSEYQVDLKASMRQAVEHVVDRIVARGVALSTEQTSPILNSTSAITNKILALEESSKASEASPLQSSHVKGEILKLKAERSKMVDPEAVKQAFKAFDSNARSFISNLRSKTEAYLDEDSGRLIQDSAIPYLVETLTSHLETVNALSDSGTPATTWRASLQSAVTPIIN